MLASSNSKCQPSLISLTHSAVMATDPPRQEYCIGPGRHSPHGCSGSASGGGDDDGEEDMGGAVMQEGEFPSLPSAVTTPTDVPATVPFKMTFKKKCHPSGARRRKEGV